MTAVVGADDTGYGVIGLWSAPADAERAAFEREYADTYLPLVHRVPHVVRVDTFLADEPEVDGGAYRMGSMYFADESDYRRASQTPEWDAMFAQCRALLDRFGITMRYIVLNRDGRPGKNIAG